MPKTKWQVSAKRGCPFCRDAVSILRAKGSDVDVTYDSAAQQRRKKQSDPALTWPQITLVRGRQRLRLGGLDDLLRHEGLLGR